MKLKSVLIVGLSIVSGVFAKTVKKDVIAYANNGSSMGQDVVDIQVVPIPDDGSFLDAWTSITSANPQEASAHRWQVDWGVTRNRKTDRIISVWVKAAAGSKDSFGSGIWVGNLLHVEYSMPD